MICENIAINEKGHLTFAGKDTLELAESFSTPLYLMDEAKIRNNCRTYLDAFRDFLPKGSKPCYASKACSFKQLYRIMQEEGMGVDVVSRGEMYTAFQAGFDMSQVFFHGNNKTDEDLLAAIEMGVGVIVADNIEEISAIDRIAGEQGLCQKIFIRITPGIDTHTYEAVNTGKVDSKFGSAIETGAALDIVAFALGCRHISLEGLHCHVGSQVFEEDVFERSACVMLDFIKEVKENLGFTVKGLNLGGGYGVRYVDCDPHIDIRAKIKSVAASIRCTCAELGLDFPVIYMEPGRSIVADAGMTLYTVGSVKRIPGFKNYVSIDGGMTDNPRYALYRSKYTVLNAGRATEECSLGCTLAGRCCESGDLIAENINLPEDTSRGDVIAVCTTGAYNYSMASNYNRLPRPAVVMLSDNGPYVAVKRESLEDIIRNDI